MSTVEGKSIAPRAVTAPMAPPVLRPMQMAIFVARGPGRVFAIAMTSMNSSGVIHP